MRSKRKKLNRDLLDAVVMRDIAKVQDLLNQGADVNARDEEHHETPLILATKFADPAIVRLLLNANAEVDARDDKGRTALFFASVPSEAFKGLLEAGANLHARDEEGNTILLRNVSESPSLNDVEELLKLGIDPALRNAEAQSALDVAESLGLIKIVERLRAATAV
jgi:ankyrin repeat protein